MSTAPKESPKARFERIKAEVLLLTPKQQQDVITLLGAPVVKGRPDDEWVQTVYRSICAELATRQGTSAQVPYSIMAKTLGSTLPEAARVLSTFIDEYLETAPRMTSTARMACVTFLVTLCARHVVRSGLPVSHRTIAQQLTRTPDTFEGAYPGYLRSGLARLPLRSHVTEG